MGTDADNEVEPWFTGRSAVMLLHRINRRPFPTPSLFARQPASFEDHLTEALLFGEPVITGRRNRREWRLGNRQISERDNALYGQVGWIRTDSRNANRYNAFSQMWEDAVEEGGGSARAPFVIDLDTRILGVLQHPTFRPETVADVFQTLLRRGELQREETSTEWSVEPILDRRDFTQWLHEVDSVRRISMTAKLPNPDALPEFGPVWSRMEEHKARLLKEIIEASDTETGLQNLEQDEQVRAFLAMGENAFGFVVAEGERDGRRTKFDQRRQAAHERTDELPASWTQVLRIMLGMIRGRRRDDT